MADTLEGTTLPTLTLLSSSGAHVALPADFAGRWLVLYFYPKDDTPGCTRQACTYRDNADAFDENGAVIVGVSADGLESHQAFVGKYSINFPLLVDAGHALANALGVWRDAEWNGQKYTGLQRDSFLVDPHGVIRRVWRGVDPSTTMAETFDALVELRGL